MSWEIAKRRVLARRKATREMVWRLPGYIPRLGDEAGARRSEREPVRRRAKVENKATIETFKAGEFEGGAGGEEGG